MSDTMIVKCPHCSEKMSVLTDYAGLEGHCPKCKKAFVFCAPEPIPSPMPSPIPPQTVVAVPASVSKVRSLRKAAWTCFGVGMILLILCPIIPFYSPFFVASFVISIILLAKDEGEGGLALLLTTLLVPVVVGVTVFMLGVGTMLAAFFGIVK